MGPDLYWPCWACDGSGVDQEEPSPVCMEDVTHAVWLGDDAGYEVYDEPCLNPLPCPKHGPKGASDA